jgi:hypothetical protein
VASGKQWGLQRDLRICEDSEGLMVGRLSKTGMVCGGGGAASNIYMIYEWPILILIFEIKDLISSCVMNFISGNEK